MTLTGLAAMPAKVLLTGMCFYLVPLYLLTLGSSQTVVGRILMAYAVAMVVCTPIAAKLATTRERMESLVGAGLLISGSGAALMLLNADVVSVFAATALVGVGQSLSISAQSALLREHCEAEVAAMGEPLVYGLYRLLERLGNALGPLLAAVLVMTLGYKASFAVIGALVMVCGIGFLLATRHKPDPDLAWAKTISTSLSPP
jgi:MFS family permease